MSDNTNTEVGHAATKSQLEDLPTELLDAVATHLIKPRPHTSTSGFVQGRPWGQQDLVNLSLVSKRLAKVGLLQLYKDPCASDIASLLSGTGSINMSGLPTKSVLLASTQSLTLVDPFTTDIVGADGWTPHKVRHHRNRANGALQLEGIASAVTHLNSLPEQEQVFKNLKQLLTLHTWKAKPNFVVLSSDPSARCRSIWRDRVMSTSLSFWDIASQLPSAILRHSAEVTWCSWPIPSGNGSCRGLFDLRTNRVHTLARPPQKFIQHRITTHWAHQFTDFALVADTLNEVWEHHCYHHMTTSHHTTRDVWKHLTPQRWASTLIKSLEKQGQTHMTLSVVLRGVFDAKEYVSVRKEDPISVDDARDEVREARMSMVDQRLREATVLMEEQLADLPIQASCFRGPATVRLGGTDEECAHCLSVTSCQHVQHVAHATSQLPTISDTHT